MPVSGLVVSLKSDPHLRAQTMAAMRAEPRIEIGVVESRRMAIVTDTASDTEDKTLWCWLNSLPGVTFVDVAMVGFEEQAELETTPCNSKLVAKDDLPHGR